jgi:hypothetical protein
MLSNVPSSLSIFMKKLLATTVPPWVLFCLTLSGIGIGVVLGVVLGIFQLRSPDPVAERFSQLESGMSLARVEEIMGEPGLPPKPIECEMTLTDEGINPAKIRFWQSAGKTGRIVAVYNVFFR